MQDLFADLRPNMTRYSSVEELDAALAILEEHERKNTTEKNTTEKHLDPEKVPSENLGRISGNGQMLADGFKTNGKAREEVTEDTDTDSGSDRIDPAGHYDEEELDEENHDEIRDSEDEYSDGGGNASAEDDEVRVRQKVMKVDPLEEADFDREFRALMQVIT